MRLYAKTVVISTSVLAIGLSGCSSTSDNDYRKTEADIVLPLEVPPNLFNPGKAKGNLALALAKIEQEESKKQQIVDDHIPNFKADGLSIQSNLSERWLEVDSLDSDEVWSGLKRFFGNAGFAIADERKDIGVLKTEYQQRSELVPLDDVSPLTKVFNSWRPELAEGVYDKFTARLETDVDAGKTRVYFSHNMLYSPEANEVRSLEERWRIKPYNPVIEAEVLYQAMVFFGSTSEKAIAQLSVSEKTLELVEGEEFDSLIFNASLDQSWSYLQAMVYRADWQMDRVRSDFHEMWVKVPQQLKKEDSFLTKLAFWQESGKQDLPDIVKLNLEQSKDNSEQTILTVTSTEEAMPLNAQQKRYIFENLGLLAK